MLKRCFIKLVCSLLLWGACALSHAALNLSDPVPVGPQVQKGQLASADGQRRVHPALGEISYSWRGVTVKRTSAPHGLWHFERGARLARELGGEAKQRFDTLAQRLGGSEVMRIRTLRPLEREDDALVFA